MKVYFVRHGESEANLLHEFSNRGFKHGLTQQGQQQATTLAQSLKNASVTKVFSSPLMRAVQRRQGGWIIQRETSTCQRPTSKRRLAAPAGAGMCSWKGWRDWLLR